MLSFRTIVPHTLELLRHLMAEPYLQGCRLVGGTALALQYGHRSSVDLDMFGDVPDDDQALLEILEEFGKVQGQKTTDGLRLASPKDIAAMKISAIEGRGSKKDFYDLFFFYSIILWKKCCVFMSKSIHSFPCLGCECP